MTDSPEVVEMPCMPSRKHCSWLRSAAYGFIILCCGAVIGSVLTAVFMSQTAPRESRRTFRDPDKIAADMRQKYSLNDEQEQRLKSIFQEHGKKLSEIRAEVQPRVEAEHESLQTAVETVLTPEQAKQWAQEFEQMRRPWHTRNENGPGNGPRH